MSDPLAYMVGSAPVVAGIMAIVLAGPVLRGVVVMVTTAVGIMLALAYAHPRRGEFQ